MSLPVSRQRGYVVPGFYHTHHGDVFLPGAGNVVFEPAFQLPFIQLIGAAIYAGPAPRSIGRPQVFSVQAVPLAGIGGQVAGQFVTQPLNVPETSNGSQ
jgi:hypothetical protein